MAIVRRNFYGDIHNAISKLHNETDLTKFRVARWNHEIVNPHDR